MRVTFVISSLGFGGAERVMTNMANFWAEKGWQITLITLDEDPPAFRLHPQVRRVGLGLIKPARNIFQSLTNNIRRIAVLRRAISATKPGVVISFMDRTNVLTLIACWGLGLPVLVSERVDPRFYQHGWIFRLLRRLFYPLSSSVIFQTKIMMSMYPVSIRKKGEVIPNPVLDVEEIASSAGFSLENVIPKKIISGVGRLHGQKGFDLLIKAWAEIAHKNPDWCLEIWGEGGERQNLKELCEFLGFDEKAVLRGLAKEVGAVFQDTEIFVLSSRFEGFPNALCEAMSRGIPSIAFNCPSGPEEIIRDQDNGFLVPDGDVQAMAKAIDFMISHPAERKRMGERAKEITDQFGIDTIMSQWENLIESVISM